jgi:hypothetical protein
MEDRLDRDEASGARESQARGDESTGSTEAGGGVLTLVCFKCGMEYYFAASEPPATLSCEKCRNTVFRSFHTQDEGDEVAADFRDSTERDLHPDDAEGDTMPGDILDLRPD